MSSCRIHTQQIHKLNPKQGCKPQKSMRGIPDNTYGELKQNVTVSLTATAIAGLDRLSRDRKISRSELLEQLGRGLLVITKAAQPSVEDPVPPLVKAAGAESIES